MTNNYINRYTGESKRSSAKLVQSEPPRHPCVAIVRNHLDSSFMGGLEVQLLDRTNAGNTPNDPATYFQARYLAPFYGVTPFSGTKSNKEHQYSQKSYGMWFIPPDIGSLVLVIFAESGEAFWIGCIPEKDTNFMMPSGDAATKFHNGNTDAKLPVGEINKRINPNSDINATKTIKPFNSDIIDTLVERGLLNDETRGLTTSSARRETPSTVFGISTPGPYDRRPINGEVPKVQYGNTRVPHNRLGGSSIVMDDGDGTLLRKTPASEGPSEYADSKQGDTDGDVTIPHNEMLRLKTRTGHQILMHNSEDLIYIGNSKGTTWIELTSNGKIDIYAQDSISIHTEQDLNFKANRDVNIEADRDINLKAKKNIAAESVDNFQLIVGKDNKITTEGALDISTKGVNKVESRDESTNILSKKNNTFTATDGDTSIKSGGSHLEQTGKKIHMNDPNALPREAPSAAEASPLTTWGLPLTPETIMRRVPQAEPWIHHENLAPLNFTPTETDIKKPEERRGQGITPFPPNSGEYIPTADTFERGASRGG